MYHNVPQELSPGDARYLHTLTVALLVGTLWVADPMSGTRALRVMVSSDVA
jgi:hypothetical protein